MSDVERYAVLRGPLGRWWVLRPGCSLRLGRSPSCQLVVPVPLVSREHAHLRWLPGAPEPEIKDAGSSNGTRVDGAAASREAWRPLRKGSVIDLGQETLIRVELHACAELAPEELRQGRLGADLTALELLRHLERGRAHGKLVVTCRDGQVSAWFAGGAITAITGWGGREEIVLDRLLQASEATFTFDAAAPPHGSRALGFSDYLAGRTANAETGFEKTAERLTDRLAG